MTIALIFSRGTCIVRIQSVRVNFACTKSFFNLSAAAIFNVPQCASVCQVLNIPFEDQADSFFLSFGQGVHTFEKRSISIQDVIGDVYCRGKYCFNREKTESLDGYVITPISIFGSGICGAWLFVHKVPSMLPEHVKMKKQTKHAFLLKKRWTRYPMNNCSIISHLNQPNIEKQNCVRRTKYKRQLEMCIIEHVEMKCVFTIQLLVSTTVESTKPAATFYIFLQWTKNRQLCCLAMMVHLALQEKRVATTKKKNFFHFEEIYPPITIKHTQFWTKKAKINLFLA